MTVSVNVEFVAPQPAKTSAVTWPDASTLMLPTVTPLPVKGVAVTFRVLAAWVGSLTVAICELTAAEPCCLEIGAAAAKVMSTKQAVTSLTVGVVALLVVLRKALYFR